MTEIPHPGPAKGWLHFKGACRYLNLSNVTLTKKLVNGTGPRSFLSPGSRHKIFAIADLDEWVRTAPERQPTPAERERLKKMQAGWARLQERRQAEREKRLRAERQERQRAQRRHATASTDDATA
jgi:hypothetical protein